MNDLNREEIIEIIPNCYDTYPQKKNVIVRKDFEQHLFNCGYNVSKKRKVFDLAKEALGTRITYKY